MKFLSLLHSKLVETEFLDGIKMHYFANACMIYFPPKNLYLFLEK